MRSTSFIPSTIHLWRALDYTNAIRFQTDLDDHVDYEDYVFRCFRKMYDSYEQNKHVVPSENICHVTYDQLTQSPLETLQRVYNHLGLPDFRNIESRFLDFTAQQNGYRRNSTTCRLV